MAAARSKETHACSNIIALIVRQAELSECIAARYDSNSRRLLMLLCGVLEHDDDKSSATEECLSLQHRSSRAWGVDI